MSTLLYLFVLSPTQQKHFEDLLHAKYIITSNIHHTPTRKESFPIY
jgi:hypothetical protein